MNQVTDLSELYELMPGWVHIHRVDDLSLLSMNEEMRKDLQIKSEDIARMRRTFFSKYLHKKSLFKVTHLLECLSADGIYEQVKSYFSCYYYDNNFYRWYFTSSRYKRDDGVILSLTFPIEKIFNNSEALSEMLDSETFNRDKIALLYNLTINEKEVLKYLACGFTDLEISNRLTISPLNVKDHEDKIYEKIQTGGKANIVKLYNTICA